MFGPKFVSASNVISKKYYSTAKEQEFCYLTTEKVDVIYKDFISHGQSRPSGLISFMVEHDNSFVSFQYIQNIGKWVVKIELK